MTPPATPLFLLALTAAGCASPECNTNSFDELAAIDQATACGTFIGDSPVEIIGVDETELTFAAESVEDSFVIRDNPNLRVVRFPNLTRTGHGRSGDPLFLAILDNPSLEVIELPRLERVGGVAQGLFDIRGNDRLARVDLRSFGRADMDGRVQVDAPNATELQIGEIEAGTVILNGFANVALTSSVVEILTLGVGSGDLTVTGVERATELAIAMEGTGTFSAPDLTEVTVFYLSGRVGALDLPSLTSLGGLATASADPATLSLAQALCDRFSLPEHPPGAGPGQCGSGI